MNDNHRDPDHAELGEARLTAYALGQLGKQERAEVEARLARSDTARQFVEETRALGEHVCAANLQQPSPQPSAELRAAVEDRLQKQEHPTMKATSADVTQSKPRRSRRSWIMIAAAVCLLIAVSPLLLPSFQPARETAKVDRAERAYDMGDDAAEPQPQDSPTADSYLNEVASAMGDRVNTSGLREVTTPAPAEDPAMDPVDLSAEFRIKPGRNTLDFDMDRSVTVGMSAQGVFSADLDIPAKEGEAGGQKPGGQSPQFREGKDKGRGRPHGGGASGLGGLSGSGHFDGLPKPTRSVGGVALESADGTITFNRVAGPHGLNTPPADGQPRPTKPGKGMYHNDGGEVLEGTTRDDVAKGRIAALQSELEEKQAAVNRMLHTAQSLQSERITAKSEAEPSDLPALAYRPRSNKKHDATSGELDEFGVEAAPSTTPTPDETTPGTEQYDPIVENEFTPAVGEQALTTFSIDVDTASYANVRRFLTSGRMPPRDAVRIEELINYFSYDYPQPEGEHPFSVSMETAACPWHPAHRLLRIGLKGREIDRAQRGPSNLVFLVDVSGSMSGADKLPLVQQGLKLLTKQLGEDDRVAIVTYASGTQVRLESTNGHERQKILDAIDALSAGGSTHGSAGIQLAYEQATEHFIEGGTNRVLLATDGDLNVGITDDDELVKLITEKAKSGVFLTVLGFGTGNLKDSKLEKLADKGNGSYAYIDGVSEAHKVLVEQLTGSLITIAKDVKIQVEFNPAEVYSYRLIGYENRMLANRDFADDKKDAGEIGAGHTVTALYEIVPATDARTGDGHGELKYQRVPQHQLTDKARSGEMLTLRLRYKQPDGTKSQLIEGAFSDSGKRFGEASPDFRFASAVAAFGMKLRGSQHAAGTTLAAVEEYAAGALGDDPGNYRAEFVDLVRLARKLRGE